MRNQFEVIIVGAGPAGTSCANNLKRLRPDITILLIDRATFPRYKPCGGGISPEVMNYLDFDLTEVINYCCEEAVMVANDQHISSRIDEIFMVRREVFDEFMLNKAKLRGVEIVTGCEVDDIERKDADTIVKTSEGDFTAKFVVIAEGGRGKLARKLGIAPKNTVFAAMEYEHYTTELDGKLHINFDYDNGYAWNFPKADGLSMGIGGLVKGRVKNRVGLPEKLREYVRKFKITQLEPRHVHGHPIQLYSGRQKLVHGPILLIGEVAGCVDPLTAEGIRPAIKSGYLAAKILAKATTLKQLKKYNQLFHEEIGKDFQYARIMSYLVYNYRSITLPFISSKVALETFMNVFGGKSTYRAHVSKKRIVKMVGKITSNGLRKLFGRIWKTGSVI